MSRNITADQLLSNYLDGFLWADEDWLERDGATATYWQARLAQTTSVEVLPDGRIKWQIRTRIVENIPNGQAASRLCIGLNRYAIGWSFAYNATDRTVDAIAAVSAPPQWDTFFLRLSEKAKLSAWMSDAIAQRLAEALGGVPAFNHPDAQPGLRETYDGTYHYLETLRGRPEWILDLTPYQFPSIEDVASTIAEMVGAPPTRFGATRTYCASRSDVSVGAQWACKPASASTRLPVPLGRAPCRCRVRSCPSRSFSTSWRSRGHCSTIPRPTSWVDGLMTPANWSFSSGTRCRKPETKSSSARTPVTRAATCGASPPLSATPWEACPSPSYLPRAEAARAMTRLTAPAKWWRPSPSKRGPRCQNGLKRARSPPTGACCG